MVSYEEAVANLKKAYAVLCGGSEHNAGLSAGSAFSCQCAVKDALCFLEEQEPVEPVNVRWLMNIRGGACPRCLNWVQRSYNYCPFCGRKVKWDG